MVMALRSKFVSIALAMTLFVLPVATLAACWIPMPAMQEMAMGGARMSANRPPVSIQQGPASGSCCQLSAANAPPVSLPRAPEHVASSMAKTSSTSVLQVPLFIRTEPAKIHPRGSGASLQARLCVFLI
jgi:hypothetical protein